MSSFKISITTQSLSLTPYDINARCVSNVPKVAKLLGSNLLEHLLKLDQMVVGLDNFSTGKEKNLDEVKALVSGEQWKRFRFIKGDIRQLDACQAACKGVDYVLHEAALGSVPRSLEDPINTNENNITGSLNMLIAVRDCKVKRMVYAATKQKTFSAYRGNNLEPCI